MVGNGETGLLPAPEKLSREILYKVYVLMEVDMMLRRTFFIAAMFVAVVATSPFARSILEKKVHYISASGATGQARFWTVFFGNFDCNLVRRNPGESDQQIQASMNLQLLSSGYVEGNGYGVTGKVQSLPTMEIRTAAGERKISTDSIDFIYDYGRKVQLVSGESGDFIVNVESDKKIAKKFLMREFKLTTYFGEEILKEGSEEIPLAAIAFSAEALAKAKVAQAKLDQAP